MFKRRYVSGFVPLVPSLAAILLGSSLLVAGGLVGCGGDDGGSGGGGETAQDGGTDGPSDATPSPEDGGDANDKDAKQPSDGGKDTGPDVLDKGDSDGDGVPNYQDKCPGFDDKQDSDGDGTPDGCELCPGQDESTDLNGNGLPDCAEIIQLWLRADIGVMSEKGATADAGADSGSDDAGAVDGGAIELQNASDGDFVAVWKDRSLNGRDAVQDDPKRRPTWDKNVGGKMPAVHFQGDGDPADTTTVSDDDSLDGPKLLHKNDARTIFLVARQDTGMTGGQFSMFEFNRAESAATGERFTLTPEIGVRVHKGRAMFAHQPLGDQFHIIALDSAQNGTTNSVHLWVDGIPIRSTELTNTLIQTGSGGYRIGDSAPIGLYGFTGDISEVIVYNKQLPRDVRNAVGLDLEKRHGLRTCYAPETDPPTKVPVYLLLGGENAVGHAEVAALAGNFKNVHGDIMFWRDNNVGFQPLGPGEGATSEFFGPELAMGPKLAEGSEQPTIIIKHAEDNANLASWDPSTGSAYSRFIGALTAARTTLENSGISYQISGIAWVHGETDAKDDTAASNYEMGLRNLVISVRNYLGESNLPFAIAALPPTLPSSTYGAASVITQAQKNVASGDDHIEVVDTTGISTKSDGVHYDAIGELNLGGKLADTLLQLGK